MATFRGVGTAFAYNAGSTFAITLPTYSIGDILIVAIETDTGNTISIANWTEAPNSPVDNSTELYTSKLHIYWRRATGDANDVCAPNLTNANHGIGQSMAFYDCITSGVPFDVTRNDGTGSFSSGNYSISSITTTKASEMIIAFVADGYDQTNQPGFTIVNANLTSPTVMFSVGGSIQNGGGVGGGYGIKSVAGAIGTTTGIQPSGETTGGAHIKWIGALLNPVVGPSNLKSYNTNLKANIKTINTNPIANVKSLNTNV